MTTTTTTTRTTTARPGAHRPLGKGPPNDLGDAKKLKGMNVAQWSEKREVTFKSKRKKEVIGSGYKALTSKFGLAAAIDVL